MEKISSKLKALPKRHKGLLLGLSISIISLVLPWYSDVDSYESGITYLALNGPASLIGISALLLNGFALFVLLYSVFKKRDIIERKYIENWTGPVFLYLCLVLLSIYFHPDFGLNVTKKTLGFGAFIGVIGGVITTYSAFVFKKDMLKHNNPEIVEDVITHENPELKENWEQQKELEQKILDRSAERITKQDREHKNLAIPNSKLNSDNIFGNKRQNNYEAAQDLIDKTKGSFMYRKDL